jgi:hypothetical protein
MTPAACCIRSFPSTPYAVRRTLSTRVLMDGQAVAIKSRFVTSRGAHAHARRVGTWVRAPSRLSNEIVYPPQLMTAPQGRALCGWDMILPMRTGLFQSQGLFLLESHLLVVYASHDLKARGPISINWGCIMNE